MYKNTQLFLFLESYIIVPVRSLSWPKRLGNILLGMMFISSSVFSQIDTFIANNNDITLSFIVHTLCFEIYLYIKLYAE